MTVTAVIFMVTICHPAEAESWTAGSLARALEIADRYWGPHACAGRVEIVMDPTLPARGRGGEAIGLVAYARPDGGFDWRVESCRVSVDPALNAYQLCHVVVHEVGHLVHGPEHVGPMAAGALNPTECAKPVVKTVAEQMDEIIRDFFDDPEAWSVACTPVVAGRCRCVATKAGQPSAWFDVDVEGDVVMSVALAAAPDVPSERLVARAADIRAKRRAARHRRAKRLAHRGRQVKARSPRPALSVSVSR